MRELTELGVGVSLHSFFTFPIIVTVDAGKKRRIFRYEVPAGKILLVTEIDVSFSPDTNIVVYFDGQPIRIEGQKLANLGDVERYYFGKKSYGIIVENYLEVVAENYGEDDDTVELYIDAKILDEGVKYVRNR